MLPPPHQVGGCAQTPTLILPNSSIIEADIIAVGIVHQYQDAQYLIIFFSTGKPWLHIPNLDLLFVNNVCTEMSL